MTIAAIHSAAAAPSDSSEGAAELLRLTGITKRFPGVDALVDVDFDLRAGEAHFLFGENGAGKSTLISIIAGVYAPSAGTMRLRGREIALGSVHEARQNGISAVFQEFSLIPQLTVEENIFLGEEFTNGVFLDKGELRRRAAVILDNLGFPLKPNSAMNCRVRRIRNLFPETTPIMTSPWPFKYFDTECTTADAPSSIGFCRIGVANVLSTTRGISPNRSAIAGMSATSISGFEMPSIKQRRVDSRRTPGIAAGSVASK